MTHCSCIAVLEVVKVYFHRIAQILFNIICSTDNVADISLYEKGALHSENTGGGGGSGTFIRYLLRWEAFVSTVVHIYVELSRLVKYVLRSKNIRVDNLECDLKSPVTVSPISIIWSNACGAIGGGIKRNLRGHLSVTHQPARMQIITTASSR